MAAADSTTSTVSMGSPTHGESSGRAAMDTPLFPAPFDWLSPLIAAAQKLGTTAMGWPVQIHIDFSLGGKVTVPVAPTQSGLNAASSVGPRPFGGFGVGCSARPSPSFTPKQKRILAALLDGPMIGDVLARACGLANRSSLYGHAVPSASGERIKRGGVEELMTWGLVINSDEDGYTLTDSGLDAATQIQEG